jgi:Septum formation initiator.
MEKVIRVRRKRRQRRTGLWLVAVMVLIICGIVSYKRQELNIANAQSVEKIAELKQDIAQEKDKSKELQEKKAYVQTKKYVEEMAREKLGMVYKDEIIFEAEK